MQEHTRRCCVACAKVTLALLKHSSDNQQQLVLECSESANGLAAVTSECFGSNFFSEFIVMNAC
jgi:hypothetical protein